MLWFIITSAVILTCAHTCIDSWVLVTELVEGGELFERLVTSGTYSEHNARRITREMCEALIYLHSKKVVHADFKPENILVRFISVLSLYIGSNQPNFLILVAIRKRQYQDDVD